MAIKPERYEAKDGSITWRVRLETGRDPVTGTRRRQWVTKPTERECKAEAIRLLNDLRQGNYTAPQSVTIRDFLARFLAAEKKRIKAATYLNLKSGIHRHMIPFLGAKKLQDLGPLDVVDWLDWLRDPRAGQGLATTSVRTYRDQLNRAIGQAQAWGLVGRNVVAGVQPPPDDPKPPTVLTAAEVERFLDAAGRNHYELFFLLGFATGMREGELLGLTWADLDLEAEPGRIHIRQQLTKSYDGGKELADPKTPTSKRSLTLPPGLLLRLRACRARDNERRLSDPAWNPDRLVITNTRGKHAWPDQLGINISRLCAKAGVRLFTPHDMRHTHASLLAQAGIHPNVVRDRLGHRDLDMTLGLYTHTYAGQDGLAAAALDGLFVRPEKTDGPNGGPMEPTFADNVDSA